MLVTDRSARIEAAWRRANEPPLRDLIAGLLVLGLTEAIDALAEELGTDRATASLLVFQHGLSEPLPRAA